MRYSKQISTGLMIESQSGGDPDNPLHLSTMKDNAVNGGINESDVEVGYCTEVEHQAMIDAREAALDLSHPLQKWERDIAETDSSMPRFLEDLITDNPDFNIHEKMKTRYDAKIKIRGEKP